jgi:putative nucleotidyltransferase with HDIG domain
LTIDDPDDVGDVLNGFAAREKPLGLMPMDEKRTLKKIAVRDLRIGMYVHMPLSWDAHPFLRNKFLLSSPAQIRKIIDYGITELLIDPKMSRFSEEPAGEAVKARGEPEKPKSYVAPEKLREAIHDPLLPAPEKSRIVRDNTMVMMDNLLRAPTKENIQETKETIAELVEMILTDDETAGYLTKITSYDYYTYSHSVNVGFLAISMSKVLFRRSDNHDMYELGAGFFLHDIGKVQIDTTIVNKPGRLSDTEMNEMRRHPSLGFKVLHDAQQLTEECKKIVLQHHERNDGTGYPKGLRGDEIHLYGKICSLADVYDALTTDRPYRQKMRPYEALILMKNEMINHFQRDLFEKFVLMLQ